MGEGYYDPKYALSYSKYSSSNATASLKSCTMRHALNVPQTGLLTGRQTGVAGSALTNLLKLHHEGTMKGQGGVESGWNTATIRLPATFSNLPEGTACS